MATAEKASRPRILMLTNNAPRAVGGGSTVRTYHLARALADYGELSLAVVSSAEEDPVAADIQAACRRVIRPTHIPESSAPGECGRSRVQEWRAALAVIAMPWRDEWSGLLRYAQGLCGDAPAGGTDAPPPASRRALAMVLRWELSVAARIGRPLPIVGFCHRQAFQGMLPGLQSLLAEQAFDVIWFEHSFTFPFVETLLQERQRPALVCNTHNIECHLAERFERLPASGRPTSWWRTQSRILKRLEARAFGSADLVLACSEEDKQLALALAPTGNVSVVANGVDAAYFHSSADRVPALVPTLLFTGVFTYGPNVDAVRYFIGDIFPLIKHRIPECRFVFAGRDAQSTFDVLNVRDDSIVCVSDSEDMRPEFERAWVVVVPLRAGGGTRLKILEAMAMSCAVVSTTVGAEGVPYVNGEHLLLADTPRQFADAVVRLLADPDRRQQLGTRAAKWVRQRYDWSRLGALAVEAVRQLSRLPATSEGDHAA